MIQRNCPDCGKDISAEHDAEDGAPGRLALPATGGAAAGLAGHSRPDC
jgi:hypothetical protein